MKLIAFKLVISAFRSWLLKGQQNRSKMPINIFAKQIMFPAYETNFSTSFFIPANKLKIQHLFIRHLILNSCRTACIGSIQGIWRIWAFNTFLFCIWFWTAAELLVLALYRTFDAYEPSTPLCFAFDSEQLQNCLYWLYTGHLTHMSLVSMLPAR